MSRPSSLPMPAPLQTLHLLREYLRVSWYLDFEDPAIQRFLDRFPAAGAPDVAAARGLFEFVRDAIAHSGDARSGRVTRRASEVLIHREGICYGKAHLLAALLRGVGIPAGICYQRLMRGEIPEAGYCVHALTTVYLPSADRWIRLDARGNKPGVDAQFSLAEERLAFPLRPECGEVDYLVNYPEPHPRVAQALESHEDGRVLCSAGGLPSEL